MYATMCNYFRYGVNLIASKLQKFIMSKFHLHNINIASKKAKLAHYKFTVKSLFITLVTVQTVTIGLQCSGVTAK